MHNLREKNWKVILWCLGIFLVLFLLVFFVVEKIPHNGLKNFLDSLLSTVATVLLANVLWEFIAKKSFAESLLHLVSVSESMAASGVEAVYVDFLSIDWKSLLRRSRTFWVAVTYATTWRESNRVLLKKFISEPKNEMIVILPDPYDEANLAEYKRRFETSASEIKRRIEESVLAFFEMGAKVYLYPGTMQASYYMFDNVSIMSFYNHQKKKGVVPAVEAEKHGDIYSFINTELLSLKEQSAKVTNVSCELNEEKMKIINIRREQ